MDSKLRNTLLVILVAFIILFSFIMFVMKGLQEASSNAKAANRELSSYERLIKNRIEGLKAEVAAVKIANLPIPIYNIALSEKVQPSDSDQVPEAASADRWPDFVSITTLHFTIYGYNQDILRFIAARVENFYEDLVNDTGLYEAYAPNNQLKIYIFRDKEEYLAYTNMQEWTSGCAGNGAIYSYETSQLNFVVPHELAHLMFNNFLGKSRDFSNIRSIHEGLAVYLEMRNSHNYRKYVFSKVLASHKSKTMIPLEKLLDTSLLHGSDKSAIGLWYAQCGTLIDFLINTGGKSSFYSFANGLKVYGDVNAAINYAYSGEFSTLASMHSPFLEYVKLASEK